MAGIRNRRRAQMAGKMARASQGMIGQQQVAGANLGRQLSSRVASGAITREQAQRTAGQRNLLEEAYGPDWRTQVFGENVKGLRTGLAGAQSENPQYQAAYKAMMARRKKMIEAARRKLNGGTSAPGY